MTPDQHTIREALREAMHDLDVIRVDTPQRELLDRARGNVAAAFELAQGRKPQPVTEHEWPDFVDGDMPR